MNINYSLIYKDKTYYKIVCDMLSVDTLYNNLINLNDVFYINLGLHKYSYFDQFGHGYYFNYSQTTTGKGCCQSRLTILADSNFNL